MKQFFRKLYTQGCLVKEIMARLKTVIWYKQLFGKIGSKCTIFKPLRLINPQNIKLGDNVRIYKNSRIETIEKSGAAEFKPEIIIGSRTSVEQQLHLICASKVEIGEDVVISANVMITDNNHSYKNINTNVMKQSFEIKDTIIGDYCFIGMGAKIMAGTKLGKNCIVGSNSVVIGEFPDYSVLAGIPAKIIKRYDFKMEMWRKVNGNGEYVN
jgi:acetyltransferase-like isoleucine patch superfamily enzyme